VSQPTVGRGRRQEVGPQPDRVPQGLLGARDLAGLAQQHAAIELDGVQQRVAGVALDPQLVELLHERGLAAARHGLGRGDQLDRRQVAGDGPPHARGELGGDGLGSGLGRHRRSSVRGRVAMD